MTDAENEQIKTMKEFMSNYNKLSEVCFADCIWDFTTRWLLFDILMMMVLLLLSRKISGVENQCALYCTEKYLKMNQRISTRFQEFQMMSNENAMAVIKKSGQLWFHWTHCREMNRGEVLVICIWHLRYYDEWRHHHNKLQLESK